MFRLIIILRLFAITFTAVVHQDSSKNLEAEKSPQFWESLAKKDLFEAYYRKDINHKAKNVILFLGDGMGISTITPSRILKGQLQGKSGEEEKLVFENFPNICLIKTYNFDYQVPDSAGTATAFLTGVKTNLGVLGVNARVKQGEGSCETVKKNSLTSIFNQAFESGMKTGIVTTTRITHATPAAGYASVADRGWEGSIPHKAAHNPNGYQCKDIARQLVEDHPGDKLNVILGGGGRNFYPRNYTDPFNGKRGKRNDSLNLIENWLKIKERAGYSNNQFRFVNNRDGLLKAQNNPNIDYLFGIFNENHMSYDKERDPYQEPSLEEMTETAIKLLQNNNNNGFLLLVEGGRIDMAHHHNYPNLALYETLAFDKAIEKALNLVNTDNTLIVVTADHSHAFTMNGYPKRGNNIVGIAGNDQKSNKPFTTLMYANGPGHKAHRIDPSKVDTTVLRYRSHSAVYLKSANHGGEDVALYSIGPMSHMFRGTKEQSYVAHAMQFAACIGQYANYEHCYYGQDNSSSATLLARALNSFIYTFKNFWFQYSD